MTADSPTAVRSILQKIGLHPSKRLGQNFLCDGNWIRKATESIPAGWPVVEIGPGIGALTEVLLRNGHPVHAVEIDSRLCQFLSDRLAQPSFGLIEADAVSAPLGRFSSGQIPFAVLSNLPFSITSPWIDSLLHSEGTLPSLLALILQREGMDRLCAATGTKAYGPTAIRVALAYDYQWSEAVPASAFYPSPSVESRFGTWLRRDKPRLFSRESVQQLRRFFGQRRKMIRRGMKELLTGEEISRWTEILAAGGLSPTVRAEEIGPQIWWELLEG